VEGIRATAQPLEADLAHASTNTAGIPTFIPTTGSYSPDSTDRRDESDLFSGPATTALTGQRELHDLRRHEWDPAPSCRPFDQRTPHPV